MSSPAAGSPDPTTGHLRERKPSLIGWEITSYCNLSCPHCFSAAGRRPHPQSEMGTEECRRVIDAMATIGVDTIGWTGGEPLLRQDLEELTAYAAGKGISANITTNAVLLDVERANRLLEVGIRAVQISLDGSTPERNRRIRGASDEEFHRIINAIRLCKRLNLRVHLATLIGRETLDDAREMVKLGKREGVDAIRFCGFAPVGRGKRKDVSERLGLSGELQRLLEFVHETQNDRDIVATYDVSFGPTPPDFAFHRCAAGIETFYLKGNGDVYPCTALLDKRFRVGNVREKPLEELWNSPKMPAMSEFSVAQIEGPCQTCENLPNCHGACRGATLAHGSSLHDSFPLCLYRAAVAPISPRYESSPGKTAAL